MATAVIDSKLFTAEVIEEIQRILKHGNSVELKRENNRLVVCITRESTDLITYTKRLSWLAEVSGGNPLRLGLK